MIKSRTWYMIVLLACLGAVALYAPKTTADPPSSSHGTTYLLTIKDATTGDFASRGVITLHGDRTLSAIDSAEGGPDFFFTSQLGVWEPDGKGGAVGRTLDFDFPPAPDVARLDYTFEFSSDGKRVTGTITLTTFPLQGDPLDGGGTVAGEFTFDGTRVRP
jgi:hypothetical protein